MKRVTLKQLEKVARTMTENMDDTYRVRQYKLLGNRKNHYYMVMLEKNGYIVTEIESKKEMLEFMKELMKEELGYSF